jgi:hypothetical protein
MNFLFGKEMDNSFSFIGYQVNVIGSGLSENDTPWVFDTKQGMLDFLSKLEINDKIHVEIYFGKVQVSYKG